MEADTHNIKLVTNELGSNLYCILFFLLLLLLFKSHITFCMDIYGLQRMNHDVFIIIYLYHVFLPKR